MTGFTLNGVKAVYDRSTKTYTVKESLAIKAVFSPKTKNHEDMVVFTCRGCAIIATKGKEKAKALRTMLLKRFNLKEMNWSTLVAKCEPIQPKEKKAVEAVAETVAKAC